MRIFECVPNVSDGRDAATLDACARAIEDAGVTLAHRTSDSVHNRSVFTFFGERGAVLDAALALARVASERIDMNVQRGAHPRIGALDVLPFVPFGSATFDDAIDLAREAAARLWRALAIPCYFYGAVARDASHRLLADVRAGGFEGLAARADAPDVGDAPHARAGAVAVGVRPVLVAFNVILATGDVRVARAIATRIRERDGGLRTLRALGIALDGERVQVSCNVTDAAVTPLHRVLGLVRTLAAEAGVAMIGSESIGLVPRSALEAVVAHAFAVEGEAREMGRDEP